MRKDVIAIVVATGLMLQNAAPVRAGIYAFATEFTQTLNYGQLVNQYLRQGEQLSEALKQTEDLLKNSQILDSQIFGPIMGDITQLAAVVQGGMALAYSMANLDAEFRSRFRGYAYNSRKYFVDYRDWSQTALDTAESTLRAAGVQSDQLFDEQAVLDQLREMSQTSDGRMEALQVANQIAEQQVQQLMKLRELMLADLQSKQAFQGHQIQKDAAIEAAVEQFFPYERQSSSGNTYQAGWK